MRYKIIKEGIFLSRPNRFVAFVLIDGKEEKVHVKNTGRCRELLAAGARVILEEGQNPNRKTKYSLIAVWKGELLVNMDSQAPNKVAEEALLQGKIREIGEVSFVKREARFGQSRLDFYLESGDTKAFLEVKGVTLEQEGICYFPDAPTSRGKKHMEELVEAVKNGYEAYVLFIIQMEGMHTFRTNRVMDPLFSEGVKKAKEAGVHILAYDCKVTPDSLVIGKKIPFIEVEYV
jgi:sugar fermentation stimulation protein A